MMIAIDQQPVRRDGPDALVVGDAAADLLGAVEQGDRGACLGRAADHRSRVIRGRSPGDQAQPGFLVVRHRIDRRDRRERLLVDHHAPGQRCIGDGADRVGGVDLDRMRPRIQRCGGREIPVAPLVDDGVAQALVPLEDRDGGTGVGRARQRRGGVVGRLSIGQGTLDRTGIVVRHVDGGRRGLLDVDDERERTGGGHISGNGLDGGSQAVQARVQRRRMNAPDTVGTGHGRAEDVESVVQGDRAAGDGLSAHDGLLVVRGRAHRHETRLRAHAVEDRIDGDQRRAAVDREVERGGLADVADGIDRDDAQRMRAFGHLLDGREGPFAIRPDLRRAHLDLAFADGDRGAGFGRACERRSGVVRHVAVGDRADLLGDVVRHAQVVHRIGRGDVDDDLVDVGRISHMTLGIGRLRRQGVRAFDQRARRQREGPDPVRVRSGDPEFRGVAVERDGRIGNRRALHGECLVLGGAARLDDDGRARGVVEHRGDGRERRRAARHDIDVESG